MLFSYRSLCENQAARLERKEDREEKEDDSEKRQLEPLLQ